MSNHLPLSAVLFMLILHPGIAPISPVVVAACIAALMLAERQGSVVMVATSVLLASPFLPDTTVVASVLWSCAGALVLRSLARVIDFHLAQGIA